MFEIIDTPFPPVKTVRLGNRGDFRPCSTGTNIDELNTRTLMERAETDYTNDRKIIASAAHTDRESSIENAWQEAIERISLAAWWALRRPFISKFSDQAIDEILSENNIEKPDDFSIHVGFVESVHPDYHVACSILSNDKSYPFVVLGGGCSKDDAASAAEKALYESIQSWTATTWIDLHQDVGQKVYWDTSELNDRISNLSSTTTEFTEKRVSSRYSCLDNLRAHVAVHDNIYVTEIAESRGTSHATFELARLAMKDSERISAFTPHNM